MFILLPSLSNLRLVYGDEKGEGSSEQDIMGRSFLFYAENKSFEVVEINENWFEVLERRHNFIHRVTIDRKNIVSEEEKNAQVRRNRAGCTLISSTRILIASGII